MIDFVFLLGFSAFLAGVGFEFGWAWSLISGGGILMVVVAAAVRNGTMRRDIN